MVVVVIVVVFKFQLNNTICKSFNYLFTSRLFIASLIRLFIYKYKYICEYIYIFNITFIKIYAFSNVQLVTLPLVMMSLFRQTIVVSFGVRHQVYSQIRSQFLCRNMHKFSNTPKCKSFSFNNKHLIDNYHLFNNINIQGACKFSNRAYLYYQTLKSSTIKERIYDSLILFTQILHKQSNVYFCLRLRRLGQICNLYRRLYSPQDLKNFISDHIHEKLKYFLKQPSLYLKNFLNRHRFLLSFASVGLFSWEDNRITDQELLELMKEFIAIENPHESILKTNNNNNESNCDSIIDESAFTKSFMVGQCLHTTQSWEEVINRPNFHVWRKSVKESSLYEYKGILYKILLM